MNVLSLFDGISCGQVALHRAGVEFEKYFASEVDKFAIKVARKNFPEMIHLGDVRHIEIPKNVFLLMGGSPCQGFSFAGKRLNFDDPRSQLFFKFVEILHEVKPHFFLLENVLMHKKSRDVITDILEVEPIYINSDLVSAQTRKRLYWTNIPVFSLHSDEGICLIDILENDADDKYFLSDREIAYMNRETRGGADTLGILPSF